MAEGRDRVREGQVMMVVVVVVCDDGGGGVISGGGGSGSDANEVVWFVCLLVA